MPTPVSAARQCLAADAAAALDEAAAAAARRGHAQTTSLHVVSALLSLPSSSPSPLRDALSRARSALSPRLHQRALDLCFSSALDRLPQQDPTPAPGEPPVSNSLMAAIKRSQATQRRNPETFHLYQQQQSPTFAGVRVELQQLILAMLDDPVVSRVFSEAGFRSCDVKLAVLRPPPSSVLRFPQATRCPPLFLCNFSSPSDDPESSFAFGFPFAKELLFSDGADENCRRVGEVMLRPPGKGRNPILVGAGAAAALGDFAGVLGCQKGGILPAEIAGLGFFSIAEETGRERVAAKLEEAKRAAEEGGTGALLSVGDLKVFVEEEDAAAAGLRWVVEELTRMVVEGKGKLWLMGSSASYETYMKFMARYPSVDKDWDLQLLPITSVKATSPSCLQQQTSLMASSVPLGGRASYPMASNSNCLSSSLNQQQASRCGQCNEKYEQEAYMLSKDSSASSLVSQTVDLPSWLKNAEQTRLTKLDTTKAKGDQANMGVNAADLQKKWNGICQNLHHTMSTLRTDIPQAGHNSFPGISSNQCLPVEILPSGLQTGDLTSEQLKRSSLSPRLLLAQGRNDDCSSSASVHFVSTDLTLGTVCASSLMEDKQTPSVNLHVVDEMSRWLSAQKSSVVSENVSTVTTQSSICQSYADSLLVPTIAARQKPSTQVLDRGFFSESSRGLSSSSMCNKNDSSDFKTLYQSLIERVGRQEEAICTVSETITRCRTRNAKRRGIWLAFLGQDRDGKKRVATALSELLFGSKGRLIHADLDSHDGNLSLNMIYGDQGIIGCDEGFRGKMAVDHVTEEIRRKPFSVVLLENVDKADLLVQSSLCQAARTGRFCDSHGRDISIYNTIFVVTAREGKGNSVLSQKQHCHFSEEKILSAQKWQMKILLNKSINLNAGSDNTSRTGFHEGLFSPHSIYANKRKLYCANEGSAFCGVQELTKRPKKESNPVLDLNVPFDGPSAADAESSSTECQSTSSECSEAWLDEFFGLIDGSISFKPFDFDALANKILKEINECLRNTIGSDCLVEIDPKAMEQMLAATWLASIGSLRNWLHQVLTKGFSEVNQKYDISHQTVLRLVACEDLNMGEQAVGICLPSRILVN